MILFFANMNFGFLSNNKKVVDANDVTKTKKGKGLFDSKWKKKRRVLRKPKYYIM